MKDVEEMRWKGISFIVGSTLAPVAGDTAAEAVERIVVAAWLVAHIVAAIVWVVGAGDKFAVAAIVEFEEPVLGP